MSTVTVTIDLSDSDSHSAEGWPVQRQLKAGASKVDTGTIGAVSVTGQLVAARTVNGDPAALNASGVASFVLERNSDMAEPDSYWVIQAGPFGSGAQWRVRVNADTPSTVAIGDLEQVTTAAPPATWPSPSGLLARIAALEADSSPQVLPTATWASVPRESTALIFDLVSGRHGHPWDDGHGTGARDLLATGEPIGSSAVDASTATRVVKPNTTDGEPGVDAFWDGVWTAGRDWDAVGGISVQSRQRSYGDAYWANAGVNQHVIWVQSDESDYGQGVLRMMVEPTTRGQLTFGALGIDDFPLSGAVGQFDDTTYLTTWVEVYNDGDHTVRRLRVRYDDNDPWTTLLDDTVPGNVTFGTPNHAFRTGHGRQVPDYLKQIHPTTGAVLAHFRSADIPTDGSTTWPDAYGVTWNVSDLAKVIPAGSPPTHVVSHQSFPVLPDLTEFYPSGGASWSCYLDMQVDSFQGRPGAAFSDGWLIANAEGSFPGSGWALLLFCTDGPVLVPNLPVDVGERHQFLIVVNGLQETVTLYLDGAWFGQVALTSDRTPPTTPGTWGFGPLASSTGQLGPLAVFDRALSTTEALTLFAELSH
jgi:hypothetical protein